MTSSPVDKIKGYIKEISDEIVRCYYQHDKCLRLEEAKAICEESLGIIKSFREIRPRPINHVASVMHYVSQAELSYQHVKPLIR